MIGYYVHHQGRGHLHRAVSLSPHVRAPLVGFSSLPQPADWAGEWVQLPMDAEPGEDHQAAALDPTAHGTLHWAPRHHGGLRDRMGLIAEWIARTGPRLFVSDVSVEVAVLARLMGTPVVVAAMRGDRFDRAHRLGYDLADALLAPWPRTAPVSGWSKSWLAKTVHTGAFSRYDDRPRPHPDRPAPTREVVVLVGAGGAGIHVEDLLQAREATPGWSWRCLGNSADGWVQDPWPLLCRADVVVTHAGQNAIAECAAARTPAIVIPQERPHDEQRATAHALESAGLATVRPSWPPPGEWADLLNRAAKRDGGRWTAWSPGDGAQRAARMLDQMSATIPEEWQVACASQ